VTVGASTDPAGITMVDSIKVYTRTKEAFSWPEDTDQYAGESSISKPQTPASDTVAMPTGSSPLMPVDRWGSELIADLPMLCFSHFFPPSHNAG